MRQYVISDIHGCSNTFKALLDKIELNKSDYLYLLGDYIDRGKNSSEVLDTIFELQEKKYKVFPIRGNHEEYILSAEKENDTKTFTRFVSRINKSGDLLTTDGKILPKYKRFFESLPYYYILDNFIIVHTGLNTSIENPFDDKLSMLELRNFTVINKHSVIGNRTIIHGHVPTELDTITSKIDKKEQIIPLDNGCIYNKKHKVYDHTKLGQLQCLELKSFDLISQKNVE